MFLNYAGTNLRLVRGPERTRTFMDDMTFRLPELVRVPSAGSMFDFAFGSRAELVVEDFGDYTVILAQGPDDILSVLDQVPDHRRPGRTKRLEEMIGFYMSWSPEDSFVLACFDSEVEPRHPIVVSYEPRNADVLTIPGLDGHDGKVPLPGAPVFRDFKVAFGVQGMDNLPIQVGYGDYGVQGQPWAPNCVTGFVDNRPDGPNGDYVVPVWAVEQGLGGSVLAGMML
ncbi:MAG TPA: hypothetical protein VFB59_01535 [Candidatus Saccharimonadales bacterium]|nr:hypothetical protein [Candidatus Saccharimonadales bacterium]